MKKHEKLAEAIAKYNNVLEKGLSLFGNKGLHENWISNCLREVMDAAPDADPEPCLDTGESFEERILMLESKVGCLELQNIANNAAYELLLERIEKLEKEVRLAKAGYYSPQDTEWEEYVAEELKQALQRIYKYLKAKTNES